MKKLMFTFAILAFAATANAGCWWSWGVGDDKSDKDLKGCQLGIACECNEMKGAQIGALWQRAEKVQGCQAAWGYNNVGKMVNGPQIAVVNIAREGAALQIGLININPKGFLPVFPFFNFSTEMFGDAAKK